MTLKLYICRNITSSCLTLEVDDNIMNRLKRMYCSYVCQIHYFSLFSAKRKRLTGAFVGE
jgi:hypothetical protein